MKKLLFVLVMVFISVSTVLYAQSMVTGELAGSVADQTGAVIANSAVTLTSDASGETHTATTSAVGEFRIPLLRPGIYTLIVQAPGFQKTVQR